MIEGREGRGSWRRERRREGGRERQGGRKQIQRTRALFTSIYLML